MQSTEEVWKLKEVVKADENKFKRGNGSWCQRRIIKKK